MKLRGRHFSALTALCACALLCACAATKMEFAEPESGGWETVWSDFSPPPMKDGTEEEPPKSDNAQADAAKPSSVEETVSADTTKPSSAQQAAPVDTTKPSSAQQAAPVDTTKPSSTAKKAAVSDTAQAKVIIPARVTRRQPPVISDSAKAAFHARFVQSTKDSLLAMIRSDYALCVGDTAKLTEKRLMSWKERIDSLVMVDSRYVVQFRAYVKATGLKAHDVRPCEPIAYAERRAKEERALDSMFSARRAARDKELRDSLAAVTELHALKHGAADILGIPAAMSMPSMQTLLAEKKIKTRVVDNRLQADKVEFKGMTVSIAFYFTESGKMAGYEIETEALRADRLDGDVRGWAAKLTHAYEEMLGPPNSTPRVSFRDIRQGRLSITANWEKSQTAPKTLIGLATHDNLYYAKVMVAY